jgi:hypothetical protein
LAFIRQSAARPRRPRRIMNNQLNGQNCFGGVAPGPQA